MDEACQSCRYFGFESTLETQSPPQCIKCRGPWMAGREAHRGQEGKHTSPVGGWMDGFCAGCSTTLGLLETLGT